MIVTLGPFWGRNSAKSRRQTTSQKHSITQIEQFETRLLLTGNVLVSAANTSVAITGDAGSNEISFMPGPTANTITVTGLNGTTVNGQTSFNVTTNVKTFKVNLSDGDDILHIDDVTLPALTMNLGNGDDLLEIERSDTRDVRTTVNGKTNIKAGNGNDIMRFGLSDDPQNFVSFKSSVSVNGGKGSDKVNAVETSSFVTAPKVTAVEAIESNPVIETDSLTANVLQILVNTNEQVDFTAIVDGAADDTVVKLFAADATGSPVQGGFLLNLFDDGSPLHHDAVAGDGIFNNTFAINLSTTGDRFYAAQVLNGSGAVVKTLSTHITAVAAPSEQESELIIAQNEELNEELQSDLDDGLSVAQALANIKAELLGLDNVVDSSISVTDVGIFWMTTNGETHGLLASVEGDGATHGSPNFRTSEIVVPPGPSANVSAASDEDLEFTGSALILAPFFYQFEVSGTGDESDNIDEILTDAGLDSIFLANTTQGSTLVGVNSFKNLGLYDVVSISAHGADVDNVGEVILTGERVSIANKLTYQADITAGRLIDVSGYWAITPSFITYYSGQMEDSIIYVSACEDAHDGSMAAAFRSQGAAAYIGYTEVVHTSFSNSHGISLFDYLTEEPGNTVSEAPGINVDIDPIAPNARYVYFGDPDAQLPTDGDLLRNTQLFVSYTWPVTQRDLDSSTQFVGSSVGYANNGSQTYLTFSGDDTTAGGEETVFVDLKSAFDDGAWGGSVDVSMNAGWYIPAEGSGPALLTVAFYNTETGRYSHVTQRTISPGAQSGAAATPVGTAYIVVNLHDDEPEDDTIEFELI